ncbi:hypothetical protein GDO81_019979 [Engystomops pustulosus]|uniref:Uncharacterized protein n=1 Tax=Engystomops pustulosus TaxID=76066 RepID=A0AAV6Z9W6_ENGPU|nr:hypothetical protein GDO81_019979 [Engystomops pustulosus]
MFTAKQRGPHVTHGLYILYYFPEETPLDHLLPHKVLEGRSPCEATPADPQGLHQPIIPQLERDDRCRALVGSMAHLGHTRPHNAPHLGQHLLSLEDARKLLTVGFNASDKMGAGGKQLLHENPKRTL